jgi:hypothetical protein
MEVETSWLTVVKEETRENLAQRILRPIRVPMGI